MSFYSLLSSFLSYVFTTIIYLFIFSIIVLIYKDIKRASSDRNVDEINKEFEDDNEDYTAILENVKNKVSSKLGIKSRYRIGSGPIVVGRGEDCDIVIPDVYLSQKHFEIRCKDGNWSLRDLKSKNGTYVNDIRVKKPVYLDDEDVISFGDVQFLFYSE